MTDDPRRRPNKNARFTQESYVISADLKLIQTPTTRQAVNVPITVFATGRAWATLLPSQDVEVTGRLARPTPGTLEAAILLVRSPPRVLTPRPPCTQRQARSDQGSGPPPTSSLPTSVASSPASSWATSPAWIPRCRPTSEKQA
ncbi:hypothetical protein ACFQ0B_71705 [Nonomuraea thailandensis]